MKKFTIVILSLIMSGITFAQNSAVVKTLRRDLPTYTVKGEKSQVQTKDAVWSNDFSTSADWIIGETSPDGAEWVICTEATAPEGFLPVYGMPESFESTTADNGFALWNSDIQGGSGGDTQDAWIQIANAIDLSGVNTPRFIFESYFRRWSDVVTFDYSIDGGTEWTSIELYTHIEQGIATPSPYVYNLNVPELGDESNVLFRFRAVGDWDYGWMIDDISIIEAPLDDLVLMDARTNFFSAIDYHTEGSDYYHFNSHFGFLPDEVVQNEAAFLFFNAVVLNNGLNAVDPQVTITIKDPSGTEIYTFSSSLGTELASGELDTLDIAWGDDEPFLMTEELFQLGLYDIEFTVAAEGITDGNPDDNFRAMDFRANDNTYARDGDNLNGVCGPGIWLDEGNDGDMMAVDYDFFEFTEIETVWAYITSSSDPNCSLRCAILDFDSGAEEWVELTSSSLVTIPDDLLGTWVAFTFTDPLVYEVEAGTIKTLKIALEFYYADAESNLWIGEDNTVPSSFWGTSWKFVSEADGWKAITNYTSSVPMIRVQLPNTLVSNQSIVSGTDYKIYPNPTSNIITIENVQNADIQIVNITGQVVASISNADFVTTIDVSSLAQGTYFIRITGENGIAVEKMNVIK